VVVVITIVSVDIIIGVIVISVDIIGVIVISVDIIIRVIVISVDIIIRVIVISVDIIIRVIVISVTDIIGVIGDINPLFFAAGVIIGDVVTPLSFAIRVPVASSNSMLFDLVFWWSLTDLLARGGLGFGIGHQSIAPSAANSLSNSLGVVCRLWGKGIADGGLGGSVREGSAKGVSGKGVSGKGVSGKGV